MQPYRCWRVPLVAPSLAGMLVCLVAFGSLASAPRAGALTLPPAAATPEDAVRLAVQSLGGSYAGVCEATRSPEDLGKTCSRFVAERGGARAYLIGRTFSEYTAWLFVQKAADGWHYLRVVPVALTDSLTDVPWPCDCITPGRGG